MDCGGHSPGGDGSGVGSSEVLRGLALGSIELREVREMGNTLEDVFLSAVDEEKEANQG